MIIGHGKSVEGKCWGRQIDKADCVIRMWDCQWQDEKTYGKRYDIGLFEVGCGMARKFNAMNTRYPTTGWLASVIGNEKAILPENTTIIDQSRWNISAMHMGGIGATGRLQFQRGVVAACWAIENARPNGRVILVGFDNVYAQKAISKNEGFPTKYIAEPTTFPFNGYDEAAGAVKYGNHDYEIERPFLQVLAARRPVKLEFSQDHTW